MYFFDYKKIIEHPLHQIEYSIIDGCDRSCMSCSHFSPLAKSANAVGIDEFVENTEILRGLIPDVHTFWLMGGEPTLHPHYTDLLKELRRIYCDIPVGVMFNGSGVLRKKDDAEFWNFVRNNEIVWHITVYDISPDIYVRLFREKGCLHLLSLDINNRFTNLTVLSERPQEISDEKYRTCGWERLNIFIRNGSIWKCPTVEYIDLFNGFFGKSYEVSDDDFLNIDAELTRDKIAEFKKSPSSFCKNCELDKRFSKYFTAGKSERRINEWMA